MPFSVYIAKPSTGAGYDPNIYKVGKTTEADAQSRVDALNDAGSNYPTVNGENWVLVDHFKFANQEQMDAFETAMAANLGTGVDPQGAGATELFESAAIDADVHDAALAAVQALVEQGLIDVATVAALAAEHGAHISAGATEALLASAGDLPEETVEEIADLVLELLSVGVAVLGIALLVWRGKRIYSALKDQWDARTKHWKSVAPPRPAEPEEVTEADEAFRRANAAAENRRHSN